MDEMLGEMQQNSVSIFEVLIVFVVQFDEGDFLLSWEIGIYQAKSGIDSLAFK
jgi:hypothetical protein